MLRTLFAIAGNLLALVALAGLLARFVPPDLWWPPSTIALALPGLLLLNFVFVLLCLYRKWWKALVLPALVMVGALPLTPRLFAFGGEAAAGSSDATVKLVTANVHSFKNSNGRFVGTDGALAFIGEFKPDILLLQEARHDRFKNALFGDIKAVSGLEKRHQPSRKTIATYADDPKFIADVFVKPNQYNGFLVTDVRTELGTIRVINAHLQSNRITGMAEDIGQDGDVKAEVRRAESMLRSYGAAAAIRATQAEQIRRHVRESPHPVIVAGDFNDVPSSYTYQRILTPRLRDAWAAGGFGLGTTFTGPLPGLRIDFVLVDTSLQLQEVKRLDTGYSDHRAVGVTLGK